MATKNEDQTKYSHLSKVSRFNQTVLLEAEALNNRLDDGEIVLMTQVWNIQIFSSCFCLSLHCLMRKLQNVPYCRRSFDIL
jgi:hypothetical protein